MFKNLSIRTKFLLPAAAVFALLLAVATVAVLGQLRAEQQLLDQQKVRESTVEQALALEAKSQRLISSLYQTLTWESVGYDAKEIKALDTTIGRDAQELLKVFTEQSERAALPQEEKALLLAMVAEVKSFGRSTKDTLEMKSSSQGLGLAAMSLTGAEAAAKKLRRAGFEGCWVIALGTNDAANVAAGSAV